MNDLDAKAELSRRDGFVAVNISDGPFRLDHLLKFVQMIFPAHQPHQLAITEAEDGELVVTAQPGIENTTSN
jgi:hypothetical protein